MFKINRMAFLLGLKAAKTVARENAAVIVRGADGLRITVENKQAKPDNCGITVSTLIRHGDPPADFPAGTPTRWQIDIDACKRILTAAAAFPGDMVVDDMNHHGRLSVKCGGVSFCIGVVCSGNLPDVATPADHGPMTTYPRDVVAAIYEVVTASGGRNTDRPRLSGVAICQVEGVPSAFATDGRCAAAERLPDSAQALPPTWLHRSVVKYLAKAYPFGADVQVSGADGTITRTRLDCSPTTWSWDTQTPVDIAAVIPTDEPVVVLDVTEDMSNAFALAASTTQADTMFVTLEPDENRPGVALIRHMTGATPFFAEFASEQAPIRIGLCAIKVTRVIWDRKRLTMELRGPTQQVIIRRGAELVGIVMPVRI